MVWHNVSVKLIREAFGICTTNVEPDDACCLKYTKCVPAYLKDEVCLLPKEGWEIRIITLYEMFQF